MAKSKYKLGTLLGVGDVEDQSLGIVEEVRFTDDGVAYKLTGVEDAVSESDVHTAWRQMKERTKRAEKKTKTRTTRTPRARKTSHAETQHTQG